MSIHAMAVAGTALLLGFVVGCTAAEAEPNSRTSARAGATGSRLAPAQTASWQRFFSDSLAARTSANESMHCSSRDGLTCLLSPREG